MHTALNHLLLTSLLVQSVDSVDGNLIQTFAALLLLGGCTRLDSSAFAAAAAAACIASVFTPTAAAFSSHLCAVAAPHAATPAAIRAASTVATALAPAATLLLPHFLPVWLPPCSNCSSCWFYSSN